MCASRISPSTSVNHLDRGTPLGPLGVIDLSEIEDLPRADAVARPHALGDAPAAVLLPTHGVFDAGEAGRQAAVFNNPIIAHPQWSL
jgi:hypothetical protein